MRCLSATLALVLAAAPAAADTRALVAVDSYVATTPDGAAAQAADVALSAKLEWRADDAARAVVADWVERESLVGQDARRELQELSYTERGIDHLTLRAGRFHAPGGYWLIVDGAGAAYRDDRLDLGVFAGSRSYTSGRVDTLLASSPHPLPLVGASLELRGQTAQAQLAYAYTYDRIEVYLGGEAPGGPGEMDPATRVPEQYADAEVQGELADHVFASAGATAGNRYLVTYPGDPAHLGDDPAVAKIYFGSQAAYGLVDATVDRWRFAATAAVLHASLGQLGAADAATAAALAPITGSFGEGSVRARYRATDALGLDARYRARIRLDGTRDQRAQLAGVWRLGLYELQAMLGLDLEHPGTPAPGLVRERSLLYRAAVARKTSALEVSLGAAAVSSLGSELSAAPTDDDQRAPYTLEARSYAFLDAFAHQRGWFGGAEGEVDLHGQGVRVLAQIGWTR